MMGDIGRFALRRGGGAAGEFEARYSSSPAFRGESGSVAVGRRVTGPRTTAFHSPTGPAKQPSLTITSAGRCRGTRSVFPPRPGPRRAGAGTDPALGARTARAAGDRERRGDGELRRTGAPRGPDSQSPASGRRGPRRHRAAVAGAFGGPRRLCPRRAAGRRRLRRDG